MDEFIVAQGNPYVRGALADGFEEHEIAGSNLVASDGSAGLELRLHFPWQLMAELRKDIANESAAVEPRQVVATQPVRRPAQGESGREQGRHPWRRRGSGDG